MELIKRSLRDDLSLLFPFSRRLQQCTFSNNPLTKRDAPKSRLCTSSRVRSAGARLANTRIAQEDWEDLMRLPRRTFLHLAAGAAALPAVSSFAWARTYPSRPVRIVVGLAPGSSPDILSQLLGQSLSERLAQQFIVDNLIGVGANLAAEAVVNAAPDGHTLLMAGPSSAISATLYQKLGFNFMRDIAPVAAIAHSPNV